MKLAPVSEINDLGPQFTINDQKMVGQDGAFSITLNDGRLFVFFGDTVIGSRPLGESMWYPDGIAVGPKDMTGRAGVERMITNCGLLIEPVDKTERFEKFEYILDKEGRIKNLLPLTQNENRDETRIWCLHGIEIGDALYLYFVKVKMIEEGPFPVNFEIVGSGLTKGNTQNWNFERLEGRGDGLFWEASTPRFGSAVLSVPGDKYLYLYGVQQNITSNIQEGFIARIEPQYIERLDKHRYYTGGTDWSEKLEDAVPIFDNFPNELSISSNHYLDCYIAVHSHIMTGKVVLRRSPAPWGPWGEEELLFEAVHPRPKPLPYPDLLYAGKEHPWLSSDAGRTIYVSYIEFEEYYPHLMEIKLK